MFPLWAQVSSVLSTINLQLRFDSASLYSFSFSLPVVKPAVILAVPESCVSAAHLFFHSIQISEASGLRAEGISGLRIMPRFKANRFGFYCCTTEKSFDDQTCCNFSHGSVFQCVSITDVTLASHSKAARVKGKGLSSQVDCLSSMREAPALSRTTGKNSRPTKN